MKRKSERELGSDKDWDAAALRDAQLLVQKRGWIYKIRPKRFAAHVANVLVPSPRRRIIKTGMGTRMYLDPLTHLGRKIVRKGVYERETCDVLRTALRPGDVFADVGAHEGVFSVFGGMLVGSAGMVLAVEPQRELRDLIEINLRLNDIQNWRLFTCALGPPGQTEAHIFLYSSMNSGMASMVKQYKSSVASVKTAIRSLDDLMLEAKVDHIDLMKVDVEGYEGAVVEGLLPAIRSGRIKNLLLDYHNRLLEEENQNPESIHDQLVKAGMSVHAGRLDRAPSTCYVLYRSPD
jgi:FkbM family methyltransferase